MFQTEIGKLAINKLFGRVSLSIPCAIYNSIDKYTVDESEDFVARVFFDSYAKKFKMEVNEAKLLEISENDPERVLGVIVHELLHVLYYHPMRLTGIKNIADTMIRGLAADHIVNRDIILGSYGDIQLPEQHVIFEELKDKNLSLEEVYEYLRKNLVKVLQNGPITVVTIGTDAIGTNNTQTTIVIVDDINQLDGTNIKADKVSLRDVLPSDANEQDVLAELTRIRDIVRATYEKCRGSVGLSISEQLKRLLYPPIPYDKILERFLKTTLVKSSNRSWKSYNKIFRVATNILQPDRGLSESGAGSIIVAVDVSGSMSKDSIAKGLGAIVKLAQSTDSLKVELLQHDVEITRHMTLSSVDINYSEILQIKGRGGTSHQKVFNYIENKLQDKEEISAVVLYTDLYSDIEYIFGSYTFYKEVPVIIITIDRDSVPHEIELISDLVIDIETGRILHTKG